MSEGVKNKLAQAVRDGFGPDFTQAASVVAEMLEWHTSGRPPTQPLKDAGMTFRGRPMHGMSREELIEAMAILYWEAIQETKRKKETATE